MANTRMALLAALVLGLGAAMGCGGGNDNNKAECTADTDCAAGKVCVSGTCQAKQLECSTDAQCAGKSKKFCSTANKCEWECKANSDCTGGKTCSAAHVCSDFCSTCKSTEYCFQGSRCVENPVSCTQDSECNGGLCLSSDGGASSECYPQCDTRKTGADKHNPDCWQGWGMCYALRGAPANTGYCLVPREPTQDLNQPCYGDDPSSIDFNDCKAGLACDFSKNPPKCAQPLPRYANCTNGACADAQACVGMQPDYYCLDNCTPGGTDCPTGFDCLEYSGGAVCVQRCAALTECTNYGTKCEDVGASSKYCF